MATELQYFLEGYINEITANNTNPQGLIGIWNRFCQFNIDTYPKYSQLIAIDYSGEYNTQSLLLKTTS